MKRPLPAISRQWMTIALIVLVLVAIGFAIWN